MQHSEKSGRNHAFAGLLRVWGSSGNMMVAHQRGPPDTGGEQLDPETIGRHLAEHYRLVVEAPLTMKMKRLLARLGEQGGECATQATAAKVLPKPR